MTDKLAAVNSSFDPAAHGPATFSPNGHPDRPPDGPAGGPAGRSGWWYARVLAAFVALVLLGLGVLIFLVPHVSDAPDQKSVDFLVLSSQCLPAARDRVEQRVRAGVPLAASSEEELPIAAGEGCAMLVSRMVQRPSGAIAVNARIARARQPNGKKLFANYKRVDVFMVFVPVIENGAVARWQLACVPEDLFRPSICNAPMPK